MKHFLLSILLILFALNITTYTQFKDWGNKYGVRYSFEFKLRGIYRTTFFSFDQPLSYDFSGNDLLLQK